MRLSEWIAYLEEWRSQVAEDQDPDPHVLFEAWEGDEDEPKMLDFLGVDSSGSNQTIRIALEVIDP